VLTTILLAIGRLICTAYRLLVMGSVAVTANVMRLVMPND
jgi:hypothetical protein